MARPERRTVDYFPHYISDGKKMFYIEQKYGNDGYASWFKILESLASTNDHFLNLNNEMDILFLSAKCRIQKDVLLNLLNDLCTFGEIDHFLWLNKIVYSQKFIDSIKDAYFRRSNKCMTYESFCIHYQGLCTTITQLMYQKKYINPQSKVKKSKEDYTKPNKTEDIEQKKFLFECFWDEYGKKTGKDKAQKIWMKIDLELMNLIIDHATEYAKSTPDIQFRKDPTTYLNGKHWEDEIIIKNNNNGKRTNDDGTALINWVNGN